MRKVDIHLGVDLDPEELTAPMPLDGGPDYVLDAEASVRPDGAWFISTKGGPRKWVPRRIEEPPWELS